MACKGKPGPRSCRLPGQRIDIPTLATRVSGAEEVPDSACGGEKDRCAWSLLPLSGGGGCSPDQAEKVRMVRKMVLELLWRAVRFEVIAGWPEDGVEDSVSIRMKETGSVSFAAVAKPAKRRWESAPSALSCAIDQKGGDSLRRTHRVCIAAGLHYICPRGHYHDRKRRLCAASGTGLQNGRLPGVRQLLRPGVPAGVDGQNHRRFPHFLKTCQNCRNKTVGTQMNADQRRYIFLKM